MQFIFNAMMKKVYLLILIYGIAYGQSLSSMTGYFNIPSGEVSGDRIIRAGAYYIHRILYEKLGYPEQSVAYFVNAGFLPFAEFSLRFTKKIAPDKPEALGDRMFSAKIRLIKEGEYFPSIAIGQHDFAHTKESLTNRFNALYAAATKNFKIDSFIDNISLTYGYGVDWVESKNNQYVGHFGGAEIRIARNYYLISEYDGRFVNGAFKANLFNHLNLLFGFIGFKYPCGGASVSFSL